MKKKIVVLTGEKNVRPLSKILEDAAKNFDAEVVFSEKLGEQGDAVLCFLPEGTLPGLTDYLKANKLYVRVRTTELKNGAVVTVADNAFGGIYDEEKGFRKGQLGREAFDVERISEIEIEKIARVAYEYCEKYDCPLTSLDLADRLYTSRLWRRALHDVGSDYPDIPILDEYVSDFLVKSLSEKKYVVSSTALFADIAYASVARYGQKNAYACYVGESNFCVYCASDPESIPPLLAELFSRTFG